jgi:epsilon-lactone hydrolase
VEDRRNMSWQARVVNEGVRLYPEKWRMSSAERTRAHVERLAGRPKRHAVPQVLRRGLTIDLRREGEASVYRVAPTNTELSRVVVFLHGGSYTYEVTFYHWRLIRFLARSTPARVEVPIYTLAPRATAAVTVAAMTDLAERVMKDAGPENVTVMGDSAGGGMSLAVAQQLRDRGAPQPGRIVLISPWLDISVSDPRQRAIEPRDHMLGIEGLAESGRMYAGDLDLRDPRVSPLFGDLTGLAPIEVFTGTDDILNVDAHRLVEKCREHGQPVHLHEVQGMQHVYPLLPFVPEAKSAREHIARLVRGDTPTA